MFAVGKASYLLYKYPNIDQQWQNVERAEGCHRYLMERGWRWDWEAGGGGGDELKDYALGRKL
jgi:hypothetical protein